jgi:DNA-binding response OmpR family regulator
VGKPFHYPELLARIENVLRRRGSGRNGPITVGPLSLDGATRCVQVSGREIRLANKEFELLRTLASEPSRVFTKQELLRDVWGYQASARTRTLDSHASRLRRKLDPERGRFVVNCWGVGYRLVEAA